MSWPAAGLASISTPGACATRLCSTSFAERRLHLGYFELELTADGPLGPRGSRLRAHELHFASTIHEGDADPLWRALGAPDGTTPALGLRRGNVMGSFLHLIDRDG